MKGSINHIIPHGLILCYYACRHGYVTPDCLGYLQLAGAMRRGDCS